FANKIINGRRVLEAVGVMVDARFANQLDISAKLLIALGYQTRVFFPPHYFVGIAKDMQQRHLGCGQWSQVVHGIFWVSLCRFVRIEAIACEDQLPITVAAFAFTESARPAFEITHRSIPVNAGDLIGIRRRPIVTVKSAATQPHKRGSSGKPKSLRQDFVALAAVPYILQAA